MMITYKPALKKKEGPKKWNDIPARSWFWGQIRPGGVNGLNLKLSHNSVLTFQENGEYIMWSDMEKSVRMTGVSNVDFTVELYKSVNPELVVEPPINTIP